MNEISSVTQTYRIRIKGHLAAHWAEWFDGMTITPLENGETLIEGSVIDQAALHGMLNHVRDLGLPLLAVDRIGPDYSGGRPGDNHAT